MCFFLVSPISFFLNASFHLFSNLSDLLISSSNTLSFLRLFFLIYISFLFSSLPQCFKSRFINSGFVYFLDFFTFFDFFKGFRSLDLWNSSLLTKPVEWMVASATAFRYRPAVRFPQPVTLTSPPNDVGSSSSRSTLRKTEVATLNSSTQRRDVSWWSYKQLLECHSCLSAKKYQSSLNPEIESDQLRE